MFLWPIIQFGILVLVALFIITQILIPALTNKPLFWFFRKPDSELLETQRELSDLNVAEEIKEVKNQIKKKSKKLKGEKSNSLK